MSMRIEQLMSRQVKSCEPLDGLNEAARWMWEGDLGCVPVLSNTGEVVGMITDRDVAMAAYTQGKTLGEIKVGDVMSSQVYACRADESIIEAEAKMRKHQVRRLPVVDSTGLLLGIISMNDIALEAEREQQRKRPSVSFGEVGMMLSAVCQHREHVALVAAE
jgi:CBS-domain-containing membrane protein